MKSQSCPSSTAQAHIPTREKNKSNEENECVNPSSETNDDIDIQQMLERCTSRTVEPLIVRESFRRAHISGEVYPNSNAYYPTLVTNQQVSEVYHPFIHEVIRRKQGQVSFSPIYNTSCFSPVIEAEVHNNTKSNPLPTYTGDEVAAWGFHDTDL